MTLFIAPASTSSSHRQAGLAGDGHDSQVPTFDGSRFASLLEDPAIEQWASESAARYGVSTIEALRVLAQALLLDAQE
jgi:hypothetical protein